MELELSKYKTIVFDCDGVVLNSNSLKTKAFYHTALPYGQEAAQVLLDYHQSHGGISRYEKFKYFLVSVLGLPFERLQLDELIRFYAEEVSTNLLKCEVSSALAPLRTLTEQAKWLIVSGGDQAELRKTFLARGLEHFFNGGIFGSPDCKDTILTREIANLNIIYPALFIGDSRYDYLASEKAGLDFLFVSAWSDFEDWESFQKEKNFLAVPHLTSLI